MTTGNAKCVSKLLCLVFVAIANTGCQTFKPDWSKSWFGQPKVQESKFAVPARMAIMWSPAVLNVAGQVPTRGFGGRIYFYDSKNNAISVEGQLVVYAYNNDRPKPDSRVPDKKFAFTPEQFKTHYSPTQLGASYSIWIPWDAAGGPQTEISLASIFTSSSGALVMEEPSRNLLPGPTTTPTEVGISQGTQNPQLQRLGSTGPLPPRDYGVQQASFQQQSAPLPQQPSVDPSGQLVALAATLPQVQEQSGISTMSISMPGTMANRLAQAPPQVSLMQKMALARQEALQRQAPGANTLYPNSATPMPATAAKLQPTLGGVPQPWTPTPLQPTHFSRPEPQAPAAPALPPVAGPPPMQPSPAAQLSGLPNSP